MRSALLYTCILTVLATITGCESMGQGKFRKAVNYYNLEGLPSTGEFPNKIYSYPSQVGGVELAKFDMSALEPTVAEHCKNLLAVAGTKGICYFGNCYEMATEYKRAYGKCNAGIAKYVTEERRSNTHAAKLKAHKALLASNKDRAYEVITKYAKDNSLDLATMYLKEQPISLEDLVLEIMKGKVKPNTYFYASCCDGYKVTQPIEDGYRLTTDRSRGIPILLKTKATMFEGNKAGKDLYWVSYDGVSSYTTITGSSTQAIIMTQLIIK